MIGTRVQRARNVPLISADVRGEDVAWRAQKMSARWIDVLRPIRVLNRLTELGHAKVKYKLIFYKTSSWSSQSSLLKLPKQEKREKLSNFSTESVRPT